jgi:hypothetical protein
MDSIEIADAALIEVPEGGSGPIRVIGRLIVGDARAGAETGRRQASDQTRRPAVRVTSRARGTSLNEHDAVEAVCCAWRWIHCQLSEVGYDVCEELGPRCLQGRGLVLNLIRLPGQTQTVPNKIHLTVGVSYERSQRWAHSVQPAR